MVDSMVEKSGIHKKHNILPPLLDVEHLGSPNDALRALIHFTEAAIENAHQHDDDRIITESALRLVAKLFRSKKLAVLVEALKKENAVCNLLVLVVDSGLYNVYCCYA